MSLDSLFQQILLSEQQLTEQKHKFKEVNVAIFKCYEKIKASTEKLEETSQELDEKTQQLCGMRLQFELLKRREEQVSRSREELLRTSEHLTETLASVKQQNSEQQERFLEELCRFNSDMSLRADPESVSHRQTEEDFQGLLQEEEALRQEMELLNCSSRHVNSILEEKTALLLELQGLDNISKDVDVQLSEAEALSQTLGAQRDCVSQKHLTDPTCVRLREELVALREAELQELRDMLHSELLLQQTMLAEVQRSQQQSV